jgi:hypothetical protein
MQIIHPHKNSLVLPVIGELLVHEFLVHNVENESALQMRQRAIGAVIEGRAVRTGRVVKAGRAGRCDRPETIRIS